MWARDTAAGGTWVLAPLRQGGDARAWGYEAGEGLQARGGLSQQMPRRDTPDAGWQLALLPA